MAQHIATKGAQGVAPITTDNIGVPIVVDSVLAFATGTGPAQNDTVLVAELPPGYELVPALCEVWGEELDSNASPTATLHLGTEADPDAIIQSGALGNAAGWYRLTPNALTAYTLGLSDSARNIIATFPAAFATAVTGKTINFRIGYKAQQPTY